MLVPDIRQVLFVLNQVWSLSEVWAETKIGAGRSGGFVLLGQLYPVAPVDMQIPKDYLGPMISVRSATDEAGHENVADIFAVNCVKMTSSML